MGVKISDCNRWHPHLFNSILSVQLDQFGSLFLFTDSFLVFFYIEAFTSCNNMWFIWSCNTNIIHFLLPSCYLLSRLGFKYSNTRLFVYGKRMVAYLLNTCQEEGSQRLDPTQAMNHFGPLLLWEHVKVSSTHSEEFIVRDVFYLLLLLLLLLFHIEFSCEGVPRNTGYD